MKEQERGRKEAKKERKKISEKRKIYSEGRHGVGIGKDTKTNISRESER